MTGASESPRLIKYGILQTTVGPSLICDLFVFIHFIRHWRKAIATAPQNHVILCLLIISFLEKITDVPFVLYYLRWGVVAQQTDAFCIIWNWWAYSSFTINLDLVMWCCFERHLFIFHNQMMKKKWCLILFHYIPLIICLLYTPLFYIAVIPFPTGCANVWDYSVIVCGSPCFTYFDPLFGTFDWLFHYATPTLVILLTNLFLFCRVIWQKIKQQQPIQWSRQKCMIAQLVFISLLYLIFLSPAVIVAVIEDLWSPLFLINLQYDYFWYLMYFINQLLPFVIVSSLPKMHKEFRQWIRQIRRRLGGEVRVHAALPINAVGGTHNTAGIQLEQLSN